MSNLSDNLTASEAAPDPVPNDRDLFRQRERVNRLISAAALLRSRVPFIVVFFVSAVFAIVTITYTEHFREKLLRADIAASGGNHVQILKESLERSLSATYALAALVRQGQGSIQHFDTIGKEMLRIYPGIANMQLAPDGITRQVVPLEGNEKVLGLDQLNDPVRARESILAKETNMLTLAGPFPLVQGGLGLVGRNPVFLGSDPSDQHNFWGFTVILLRLPESLGLANLDNLRKSGFDYKLWRTHPDTGRPQIIDESTAEPIADPVPHPMRIANVEWVLSIAPSQGWGNPVGLAVKSLCGLLVSLVLAYLAHLIAIQQRHKTELERLVHERTRELGASELRYRSLFQQSGDYIFVFEVGQDGTPIFIDANDEALKVHGYTIEEILGKPISFLDPYSTSEDHQKRIAALNSSDISLFNVRHRRRDGSYFDVEVKSQTLKLGQKHLIITTERDITERKRAEEALTHSHDLMRYIIEHNRSAVAVHDRDLRYIYVSKRYLDDYKVNERDVIGRHHYEVFPDLPQKWRDVHQKALSGEISSAEDDPYIREDGTVDWTRWECRPWYEANGSIGGIIVYTEVITERKKVEEALRESESQMRAITGSVMDAILMMDQNGRITYWNPAAERIFGHSRNAALGKNLHQFIAPKRYHEAHQAAFAKFRLTGQGNAIDSTLELEAVHKNGQEISVELSLSALHQQDGWHTVGVLRDITERKKAEMERAKLEAQLLQAQKMESIGSLAGGIAHDLNNILFPICGFSEMLLDGMAPYDPAFANLEHIHQSAMRGSDLVKQVLAFSRQSNPQKLPIRIQPILKEVLHLIRATIPKNIEIISRINPDCGMVSADPTQMHQIAMNLVTNAYHAVETTGGSIDINLEEAIISDDSLPDNMPVSDDTAFLLRTGRYAYIRVSDTGPGIEPDLMHRIFEPYFTTKEMGKGTGLGLSVVHGIIKEHGGDIRVSSNPGEGAVFHVYIPLIETVESRKNVVLSKNYPTGIEHILLVDDEYPILKMEQIILENLGYQVTAKASSPDALGVFRANPACFDLVISDLGMPSMTGEQLAKELISIKPDIPIIICTGFSDEDDENRGKDIGVKAFLKKPVAKGDLAEIVRNVLDDAKMPASR